MKDRRHIKTFEDKISELNISDIDDSSWDEIAEDLMNKFSVKNSPSHVISDGDYNNPYDYLLPNITVKDVIEFIKNYH